MKILSLVLFCHRKTKINEMAFGFVIPQSQYANLTMLQQLPEVKLDIEKSFKQSDGSTFATIKIKNPSDYLAFMIPLDLRKKTGSVSVAPISRDENYMTLLPGEEREITGHCHTKDLDSQLPEVTVDGWNIK
jgi:exo-1,4-beta-D-glucosaminidase